MNKFDCACDAGYNKGVLKKVIENNIFTIFGNLSQENSIVIRYHGILTETTNNTPSQFNMFYFFNNKENEKKTIKLQKCNKCVGDCYCATIDLETNDSLSFGFFNDVNNYELNGEKAFFLDISPNPISNLMQRYGFEKNTKLPVCEVTKGEFFIFKNIINKIKNIFFKVFDNSISI